MARPIEIVRLNGNDKLVIDNALMLYRKRFENFGEYDPRNEIGEAKRHAFDQINELRRKVIEL
jgi:hypothetical protein